MITFKDHSGKADLYPFTLLRDTEELFSGAFSNKERWAAAADLFHLKDLHDIPSNSIPLYAFWEVYHKQGITKAFDQKDGFISIVRNWDFIIHNEAIIKGDIQLLKSYKKFQTIPDHVKITGPTKEIYVEEGATLENVILNTTSGPIYISKGALIMDGTCIRGPVFIGENSVIKMGATIYGGTSIGKKVIAGGEIKNSIINAYSNKAHHGYLGDSIIGEWCNLGAGTTVSNLKNTGNDVTVWNMHERIYESVGKKCGTIMGDFSRTSINTNLNTGTIIGICSSLIPSLNNLPKYIPNFTWYQDKPEKYILEKALIDIQNWMSFKGEKLNNDLKNKLTFLFNSPIL